MGWGHLCHQQVEHLGLAQHAHPHPLDVHLRILPDLARFVHLTRWGLGGGGSYRDPGQVVHEDDHKDDDEDHEEEVAEVGEALQGDV